MALALKNQPMLASALGNQMGFQVVTPLEFRNPSETSSMKNLHLQWRVLQM
jgi:hypothetical protein